MAPDPLALSELDPKNIDASVAASKVKAKPTSELDLKKEERLSQKEQRLAAKQAHAASGPSALPPPPPVDPSKLLDKIAAYKERFPFLKSRNKVSAKSTIEELEDEIHFLELQLGSSKDGSTGTMIFVGAMMGLETVARDVWNPLGLKLQGLGQVAKDNTAEVQDIIDELMIKYSVNFYMQPEYRLVLAVGAMVVTVHSANSGDSRLGDTMKKMSKNITPPASAANL